MSDWNDAESRVEKAQEFFEQHRWNEALEELRAAISINPYNSGWFFNIGLTLDEMERFDEAIDAYRKALEIEPDDLQAMQHLGLDLHRLRNFPEALRTFERMEAIDSSCEASYCHRIMVYADTGEHDRAEEMFYLARLYKEHCPHCYYNMGCSLRDRRLFDKAIYCWQKTLDLDEAYPQVQIRIAEALWGKGELESARQHFLTGLRQDPGNMQTVLDLGELLTEMGRWEEAGEKFRRAIELAPEQPAGYFCYGCWLARIGQEDDAIASLTRALSLDPTFPGAHLRLAELYHARQELSLTRKHSRAELMLRPQEPTVLLDLSNLLFDTAQERAAIACLKRLTQIEPDSVQGWQNLSVAQFTAGRHDEGISSGREALRLEPRNLAVLFNLALACERHGRFDRAAAWIRRGLEVDPVDISLQRLRARVRFMQWRQRLAAAARHLIGRPSRRQA